MGGGFLYGELYRIIRGEFIPLVDRPYIMLQLMLLEAPEAVPGELPLVAFWYLLPVVFIAIRSPVVLAALPSLALRFIDSSPSYWGTDWHYNATVMPIVFVAATGGADSAAAVSLEKSTARSDGTTPCRW